MILLPKLIHASNSVKIYSYLGNVITIKEVNGKDVLSIDGGEVYPAFDVLIACRDYFLNDLRTYVITMEPVKKREDSKIIYITSKN